MADASKFSVALSAALDSLGINQEMLQFKKSSYLKGELSNVFHEVSGCLEYMTGSQIEGTTIALLYPDSDGMVVNKSYTIINNLQQWRPNQNMLLITNTDVHPGYVKLKSLDRLQPGYRCDIKGDIWFSSRDFVHKIMYTYDQYTQQQHGPAVLHIFPERFTSSCDAVVALLCSSWPFQAREWLTRVRGYNWPPKKLLRMAEKEGYLLVPVGVTGSLDEDIEWRFSFSLLERELVWSWNTTQRKCLFFLKLMLRNYFNKKTPDVLSSYHLKTLMFWMVEETPVDEWVPGNLAKYIIKALTKLLKWVQVENCPSYFIRANNMFDGKLECQAKRSVIESIQKPIDMGIEQYLFTQQKANLKIEGLIVGKLDTIFGNVSCMDKEHVLLSFQNSLLYTIVNVNDYLCLSFEEINMKLLESITSTCVDTVIEGHKRCLAIGERFLEHANDLDREIMQLAINSTHSSLGSHLFAKALQTHDVQTRDHLMSQAIRNLDQGQHVDIASGRLKLATCYYMNNEYHKASDIVGRVLASCGPNTMLYSCTNFIRKPLIHEDMYQLKISPTKILEKHYALEVSFLSTEEPVVPRRLKYECLIYQLLKTNCVAVDPVVYSHFLQCSCHFHTKQADKLLNALQTFHGHVQQFYKALYRKPSALNLLAHCCIMAGKYKSGLDMLAKSMNECSDNIHNGAPWILAVLVFDALRSCKT